MFSVCFGKPYVSHMSQGLVFHAHLRSWKQNLRVLSNENLRVKQWTMKSMNPESLKYWTLIVCITGSSFWTPPSYQKTMVKYSGALGLGIEISYRKSLSHQQIIFFWSIDGSYGNGFTTVPERQTNVNLLGGFSMTCGEVHGRYPISKS